MNPEYDFADENEVTNEKQADEQSTGDHEDSDEEGVQGPPPPTKFKRLLEVGVGQGFRETGSSSIPSSDSKKHSDSKKQWKPRQPLINL